MGRFEDFLKTRRSEETSKIYGRCILQFDREPDSFLSLAERDPKGAEKRIIDYFLAKRTAGASQRGQYHAIKSFLVFNDVELKWKKISSTLPVGKKVAGDRAPTREEIAELLEFCDLRSKMIVLCMASGGFRVGAWNWLKVGDVSFLKSGLSRLHIYAGEPEEYDTFVTPEATRAVKDYLESRKRAGEKLTPSSPLARNRWDLEDGRKKLDIRIVKGLTMYGVEHILFRAWWASGIRNAVARKHEFKQAHGFRKYFKTTMPVCQIHGDLDKEILLGHFLSYHKPTLEHLEEFYLKAVPYLSIDEKFRLKEEMESKDKEHKLGFSELRLQNLEQDKEIRELKAQQEAMSKVLDFIVKHPESADKVKEHFSG